MQKPTLLMKFPPQLLLNPLFLQVVQGNQLQIRPIVKALPGVLLLPLVYLALMDGLLDLAVYLLRTEILVLLLVVPDYRRYLLDVARVLGFER